MDKIDQTVLNWLKAGRENPHATLVQTHKIEHARETNRRLHQRLAANRAKPK